MSVTPEELTHVLLLAINQHIQFKPPSEDALSILAETYIRLVQDQPECKYEKTKPLPDSNYIAALGTVAYYTKH
jgi:hypothetical protein